MTTNSIPLFEALGAKMDFLAQRQRIISQNVANADTPGYRPHDLMPVKFEGILKHLTNSAQVTMEGTNAMHMPAPNDVEKPRDRKQKAVYEVAPAGNAVIIEEQLLKAGQTLGEYNLMTNLYQKNVGMIRTALGTR
ncbi:MAG: flagellar basal body protein [Alphaproteobacteria bacterium]|nr:flagellar basal body protein [Alphaproteobacteria bacterium]